MRNLGYFIMNLIRFDRKPMQYFPEQYRKHIKASSTYIFEELWEKTNVNLSFLMFKNSYTTSCTKWTV